MSPPNPPLWVRVLSGVFAVGASWWLVRTDAVRTVFGPSVGALGLGVVAVFALRGTHQPLGLWPTRPWRQSFSLKWAVLPAAVGGLLIVLAGASAGVSGSVRVLLTVNRGAILAIAAGIVAAGLSFGLVRQRNYARWFALAVACAVVPALAVVLFGGDSAPATPIPSARLGVLGVLFWSVANVSQVLVTQELTFRRLLIGRPESAGVVLVLGAAVLSAVWPPMLAETVSLIDLRVIHLVLVAVVTGCLYIMSQSLLVAALYHGTYIAAMGGATQTVAPIAGEIPDAPIGAVLATGALAIALAATVVRRRGWLGDIIPQPTPDASGD